MYASLLSIFSIKSYSAGSVHHIIFYIFTGTSVGAISGVSVAVILAFILVCVLVVVVIVVKRQAKNCKSQGQVEMRLHETCITSQADSYLYVIGIAVW